jgi:hypothetical protein
MTYLNGSIVSSVRNRDKKKDDAIAQLYQTKSWLLCAELEHFEHVNSRRIQQNKCKHNYEPLPNKVIVAKSKIHNRRYEHCRKCHKTRIKI